MKYCPSTNITKRFKTRAIRVGSLYVGEDNPIRIQSMTTTPTDDIAATVDQVKMLVDAGCDIVRMTVQGIKEAKACEHIRSKLDNDGYSVPLVADIHFFPQAALHVIDFVDKVRINPGNFADPRANFSQKTYTEDDHKRALEKIYRKFLPLVEKCKAQDKSIRIGTNHGSLSDRIMNQFGDSPDGMVHSALEYLQIAQDHNFHNLIFSMKSSNPIVMVHAYRLLVATMMKNGWNYPLHLGVTEAGEGKEGRIKSAVGIGSLLLDGIGDTIRVSLTEDPWHEIDPCNRLVDLARRYQESFGYDFKETTRNFQNIRARKPTDSLIKPLHPLGSVGICIQSYSQESLKEFNKAKPDFLWSNSPIKENYDIATLSPQSSTSLADFKTFSTYQRPSALSLAKDKPLALLIGDNEENHWESIKQINPHVILLNFAGHRLHQARAFFNWMHSNQIQYPTLLAFHYETTDWHQFLIDASAECGSLLMDGLGDGIALQANFEPELQAHISFILLQAVRMRATKTEFISCPSCGRTLFNLQEVSKEIRDRTDHLPGVKIAIMGCIVNGPGEMADADIGYVGSKPGKVDLYLGKEKVKTDIDEAIAVDALIDLIKEQGWWKEPQSCV